MFAPFPEAISKALWIFWIFRAAEMRGTLQKQQIRPFPNVRSFSGSHFQGPLDFLDFWPPKAAEMRGTPQKQQNRPFRNIPGPLDFLDFRPPKAAEMRGTPQKQQHRSFRNFRSFSGSHFQGPLHFLDFSGCRNEGNLTKAANSSISQRSLRARKPFPGPFAFSGFPAAERCRNEGNPTKAAKSSISQCSLLSRKPFPGPLECFDFRPPKGRNKGNPTKAAKSFISQCSLLFRKPFPGPREFLDFRRRKLPNLQLPFDCAWAPLKITTAVGDVQAPAGMLGRL